MTPAEMEQQLAQMQGSIGALQTAIQFVLQNMEPEARAKVAERLGSHVDAARRSRERPMPLRSEQMADAALAMLMTLTHAAQHNPP